GLQGPPRLCAPSRGPAATAVAPPRAPPPRSAALTRPPQARPNRRLGRSQPWCRLYDTTLWGLRRLCPPAGHLTHGRAHLSLERILSYLLLMPLTTDLKAPLGAVRSSARSWLRAFAGALAILCTQPGPALAADETADNSESGDAPDAAASTLELYLEPRAPYESWLVHLVNTGSAGVSIPWDPRLLWMDVQVPGRSKPTRCRLPQVMLPTKPSSVQLASGVDAVFAIDPRFYCFDAGEQTTLVPGAFITAHYGYPLATRKRWVGGQAVDEPKSDQRSPFLLERDAVGESLKEVEAPGFALGSEFQVWSHTRLKRTATAAPAAPLQLRISSGTDSHSASDAAVGVTLTNISDEAVPVYFYREGLSFVVYGPGGGMRCGGSAALRAPSAERFITLRPGRAETVS